MTLHQTMGLDSGESSKVSYESEKGAADSGEAVKESKAGVPRNTKGTKWVKEEFSFASDKNQRKLKSDIHYKKNNDLENHVKEARKARVKLDRAVKLALALNSRDKAVLLASELSLGKAELHTRAEHLSNRDVALESEKESREALRKADKAVKDELVNYRSKIEAIKRKYYGSYGRENSKWSPPSTFSGSRLPKGPNVNRDSPVVGKGNTLVIDPLPEHVNSYLDVAQSSVDIESAGVYGDTDREVESLINLSTMLQGGSFKCNSYWDVCRIYAAMANGPITLDRSDFHITLGSGEFMSKHAYYSTERGDDQVPSGTLLTQFMSMTRKDDGVVDEIFEDVRGLTSIGKTGTDYGEGKKKNNKNKPGPVSRLGAEFVNFKLGENRAAAKAGRALMRQIARPVDAAIGNRIGGKQHGKNKSGGSVKNVSEMVFNSKTTAMDLSKLDDGFTVVLAKKVTPTDYVLFPSQSYIADAHKGWGSHIMKFTVD